MAMRQKRKIIGSFVAILIPISPKVLFYEKFKELAAEYKDFEVVETGWPKQDWIKIIGMI